MKVKEKKLDINRRVAVLMQKFAIFNAIKYILLYMDKCIKVFIKKTKKAGQKKQVIILVSFGVGDAILFLSTVQKYRQLYPKDEYEITAVCSSKVKMLFEKETDFDHIIELNIDDGNMNIGKRIKIYKKINEKYYDILIDALGPSYCSMNVYTSHASFAKEKIAMINNEDCYCSPKIYNKAYTKTFTLKAHNANIVQYFNELVDDLLGVQTKIEFYKLKPCKLNIEIPKEYYIVYPSASANEKKWNIEKYAQIINKLYNKTNLPVLFCGTKVDEDSVNDLIKQISVPYCNIVGKTDMFEFIQVIKQAKFIITNDSSPYHIAVSQGVPVAIIAGGYNYDKYVNYDIDTEGNFKKPYIVAKKNKCFNCMGKCSRQNENNGIWPCLQDITEEQAWESIEKMVNEL